MLHILILFPLMFFIKINFFEKERNRMFISRAKWWSPNIWIWCGFLSSYGLQSSLIALPVLVIIYCVFFHWDLISNYSIPNLFFLFGFFSHTDFYWFHCAGYSCSKSTCWSLTKNSCWFIVFFFFVVLKIYKLWLKLLYTSQYNILKLNGFKNNLKCCIKLIMVV